MHHIHVLKNHRYDKGLRWQICELIRHSIVMACQVVDNLIDLRLFREENAVWIEKAVITRIWISTTNGGIENAPEQLQELFDSVVRNSKDCLSAPATHAAQTVGGNDSSH